MGKSNPESLIISLLLFFFSLFAPSPCFHSHTRVSRDKRDQYHPCLSLYCIFQYQWNVCLIFSVLCYSKNARFAISSQGWAPGKSGMSKGSPRQHPTPREPNLHLSLESGHGSRLTKYSCCILLKQFWRKLHKLQSFPLALIFFFKSFCFAHLKPYNNSRQRPAVAQ